MFLQIYTGSGYWSTKICKKMQRFKERLIARRNALGLTQAQLAHNAGVSERSVAGFETEDKPPSTRILEKLAQALGVKATWLLGGAESQFVKDEPLVTDETVLDDLLFAIDQMQEQLRTVQRQAEKLRKKKSERQLTGVSESESQRVRAASDAIDALGMKALEEHPPSKYPPIGKVVSRSGSIVAPKPAAPASSGGPQPAPIPAPK